VVATLSIRLMDALRTVGEVWMLTGSGAGSAARYLSVHIFREVFPKTNCGSGSAISVIVLYLTIEACWLLYVSMLVPRSTRKG
jgi:multiple sugar transport system permease protein